VTAADHLQPRQFYHGSNHEFAPGDHVLSPRARNNVDGHTQISVDPDSVFITNSRAEAGSWGKHVYRVDPHTEPVNTGYMGGGRAKTPHQHFTAKSATVVKQVQNPKIMRQPVTY
jgi:hypothetical protein